MVDNIGEGIIMRAIKLVTKRLLRKAIKVIFKEDIYHPEFINKEKEL